MAQLNLIESVKSRRDIQNQVLLRVNLDAICNGVEAQPGDHFGMDEKNIRLAIEKVMELNVKVAGLHIFCGSNNFVKRSSDCVKAIDALYERVCESLGYQLELINLGGGFPVDWQEQDINFADYRSAIAPLQQKAEVIHESGRAIFGSAGYFLTEVISKKSINNSHYLICDGGIAQNFLLSKTEHIIRKYDAPISISKNKHDREKHYKFVGSSCNRDDVIGELKSYDKEILVGDKFLFKNCGAYNAVYTVNKFLALKEYKEYIV